MVVGGEWQNESVFVSDGYCPTSAIIRYHHHYSYCCTFGRVVQLNEPYQAKQNVY